MNADKAFDACYMYWLWAYVAYLQKLLCCMYVCCLTKVSQYSYLPQGKVERKERVLNMVEQMDKEGFGNCTNTGACEIECPKGHFN